MPPSDKPPTLTLVPDAAAAKRATLTRDDVAQRLGCSISTVRRYEGTQLEPVITDKGVRMFTPESVERLAAVLAVKQDTPRAIQKAAVRAAELPRGELAALVFERLEQRHSLAEIVIALRVLPEDVRELYHAWLVGLWAGELQRREPALPQRHTDADVVRRATPVQLKRLLAALPIGKLTRISIARSLGDYYIEGRAQGQHKGEFAEYRNLAELGGFTTVGPIGVAQVLERVGAGEYRVTAYGFDPPELRWEVWTTLRDDDAEADDREQEVAGRGGA